MLSRRDAETLRALERQPAPSTAAEIGRRLRELDVIDDHMRAHQILDGLRGRGFAASDPSTRPQRWALTDAGRSALEGERPTLFSVLAEYGVRVIPPNAKRGPLQTHAAVTLDRLWQDGRGEAHLRDVLTCITESENNGRALTSHVITATSNVLRAHSEWWERDASAWLGVFDEANLMELERIAKGNKKALSVPAGLTAEIYRRLRKVFSATNSTLFD